MRTYRLGHVLNRDRSSGKPFELTDDELDTHIALNGTTGGGKSRLLWQLWREHWRNGRGCCIVEPGDLNPDILGELAAYVIRTGDKSILKKIHFVELNPYQMVRYDPFHFEYPEGLHPELRHVVYRAWQHTKVQSRAEIYQWKQNQSTDFEGMPNLQRNFINILTAVSTMVEGRRLSQGDMEVLIDLQHPDHDRVYQRVRPLLDRRIQSDFEILHGYRNPRDLRNDLGSLVNRERSTHGPLFKEIISGDAGLPSLDLEKIVRSGHFLFVSTAQSPFVSNDQATALAGMFIHDIQEAAFMVPRERRRPFTLIVDEFHKYVRSGFGTMARTARKYKLGLVVATTDLVSLKRNDLDLAAEVFGVANTIISFRAIWPDDQKRLAELLYSQNIDFTELVHEVERRAGPEWHQIDEWSETTTTTKTRGTSSGVKRTTGTNSSRGGADGRNGGRSMSYDPVGRHTGSTVNVGRSDARSWSDGVSESEGLQEGAMSSDGESHGITVNHKWVHLEKIVREMQKSGMLEKSVADQMAQFAQELGGHARRRATVRVRERAACVIETAEVKDSFRSPEAHARAVEWIRRELTQVHDYYFTPTLDPQEQKRRIDAFVLGADAAPGPVLAMRPDPAGSPLL